MQGLCKNYVFFEYKRNKNEVEVPTKSIDYLFEFEIRTIKS